MTPTSRRRSSLMRSCACGIWWWLHYHHGARKQDRERGAFSPVFADYR